MSGIGDHPGIGAPTGHPRYNTKCSSLACAYNLNVMSCLGSTVHEVVYDFELMMHIVRSILLLNLLGTGVFQ